MCAEIVVQADFTAIIVKSNANVIMVANVII